MTTTAHRTLDLTSGSISCGTLRADHLADAFLGEVDRLGLAHDIDADLAHRAQLLACSKASPVAPDLVEDADETISELIDFLNDHAPDGFCFGAHEGDGSDFGWWPVSLRAMLQDIDSRWVQNDWMDRTENDAIDDIIERFDDCPESLQDFDRSDWVNLAECYTRDLLRRWDQQEDSIKALFDDYCEQCGYTSALEALEGQTIEDPEDMAAAMVNVAMTHGARLLLDELWPDR